MEPLSAPMLFFSMRTNRNAKRKLFIKSYSFKICSFSFIQKFYIKVNLFKWKGMFILTFTNNASFSKVHQRQLLNSKIIMANFCPTRNFLPNIDITHYVYLNTRFLIFISLIVLPNDGLLQSARSDKGILKKANSKEACI